MADFDTYTIVGVICTIILQLILVLERCFKRIESSSCRKVKADGSTIEMKIESREHE